MTQKEKWQLADTIDRHATRMKMDWLLIREDKHGDPVYVDLEERKIVSVSYVMRILLEAM